jgi:hypothetical protein
VVDAIFAGDHDDPGWVEMNANDKGRECHIRQVGHLYAEGFRSRHAEQLALRLALSQGPPDA